MSERTLARVVTIDELVAIEGADRIELAIVGGWQVVVQKGLYEPNKTLAVYFEVDSLLDTERPYFNSLATLSSKLLHVVDGRTHARIKTMKLRKQLSQGYMIPLSEVGDIPRKYTDVGADLTELLGVIKYEKSEEKDMNNSGGTGVKSGTSALGFPKFIPKTDQTRVQNITHMYNKAVEEGEEFEESFKLDGSSLTAFVRNGVAGVASRNVGFRVEDEKIPFITSVKNYFRGKGWKRVVKKDDNQFTQIVAEQGIIEAIRRDGRNIAVQGELVGPSIQKNFEGVDKSVKRDFSFKVISNAYLLKEE